MDRMRNAGRALRMLLAVALLAAAILLRAAMGPRLQSAYGGAEGQTKSLTALFCDIGREIFAGEGSQNA
ncbi:MAG: hypothetical protein IKL89_07360 [Clostridia bacterium]|nr:hypothetical protein [Clostridia bacterium]